MKDIQQERDDPGCRRQDRTEIVSPRAAEIDAAGEFPWDLAHAFAKQGFLSLLLPEEYGGMDGDITSFCFAVEEMAKVCGSSSLNILVQGVGLMPILIAGTPGQKERVFSRIAEKTTLSGFCITRA